MSDRSDIRYIPKFQTLVRLGFACLLPLFFISLSTSLHLSCPPILMFALYCHNHLSCLGNMLLIVI